MARMTDEFKDMQVGDTRVYPIERLATVQSTASRQGMILGRRYRTCPDRNTRTVTVERIADVGQTTFLFRSEDDRLAAEDRLRPIQETLGCVRTDGRRSISMTDPRYTELVRKVLNGAVGEGKYTECLSEGGGDKNDNVMINR